MNQSIRFLEPIFNVRTGLEVERVALLLTTDKNSIIDRMYIISIEIKAINNILDYIYTDLIEEAKNQFNELVSVVVSNLKREYEELSVSISNDTDNEKIRYSIEQNAIQKLITEYEVYQKVLQLTCASCGQTFITTRFEQNKFCKECD